MKILLDTHVWIWALTEPERLSPAARQALADNGDELALSAISVWETIMLGQRGRLQLRPDPVSWVQSALDHSPLTVLPINAAVAMKSRELAEYPGEDPADRFLVATCLVHALALITADRQIRSWPGVRTHW